MTMSSPSDAEVIGRSLGEPEAFGLIYDRHAATLLRFLGRRAGAKVAEGLVGELFRIAFERRKTFEASDRKSTRLNSSHGYISYAVFCLKKKKTNISGTQARSPNIQLAACDIRRIRPR